MPHKPPSSRQSEFKRRATRLLMEGVAVAALSGALGAGAWYAVYGDQPSSSPSAANDGAAKPAVAGEVPLYSRGLTAGEEAIAQKFFGAALDTSNVRIDVFAKENRNAPTFVAGGEKNVIRVNGERYAESDYSKTDNTFLFGALVHEFTRLSQNQNPETWKYGNNRDYAYPLRSDLAFAHYGPFQQAAIMEDYARRFFHSGQRSNWMARTYGENNCSADDFLTRVVENHFPAARAARAEAEKAHMRGLTKTEAAIMYGIFGNDVSTADVRVHNAPRECSDRIASVNSVRDMFFWSARHHSADFTQDPQPDNFGTFMHEATHIWQFQKGFRHTHSHHETSWKTYHYPLDLNKWRFDDYGVEQQASIIQDYSLAFLRPEKKTKWLPATYQDNHQARDILRRLVEARFPKAAETRLYFEKHGVLPPPPVVKPQVAAQQPAQKQDTDNCTRVEARPKPGVFVATITCG